MREKNDELVATLVEIASPCGQLVCGPTIQDHAFAYDYGSSILRLRSRLLSDSRMVLIALECSLFSPEIVTYRRAATFGRVEMLDTFISVTSLLLPNVDSAPTP